MDSQQALVTCQLTLESSDLCKGLPEDAIAAVRDCGQLRFYGGGDWLIRQGTPADSLMLPCQGQLMIERSSDAGKRQVLGFLNAGNLLGLGSGDVFLYSVQSLNDCSVLRFRRDDFERLAARYPKLRDNLSTISSQVLVRMMDHLFAIGQKRAHERLAFLLWQLSLRQGETRATRVPLAMRRVDIGDYLGLTLETTSRAFTALRRAGIIDTSERYGVTILLPDRLAELASVS